MEKKIHVFLRNSFICMVLVCVAIFVGILLFMSDKTEESIMEVSEIYLSEMNLQLQQKFTSIVGLRISQVEGVAKRTPAETAAYGEQMLEDLKTSAQVRGFTYLGLYDHEHGLETVYGNHIDVINLEDLEGSLLYDENIILRGVDNQGNDVFLFGIPESYPMEDGGRSEALVAGIPMEYLNNALYLYSDNAMVYSHLIDREGNFVIKNGDAYRDSYYERIRGEFDDFQGKDADRYIGELKEAISENRNYSTLVLINGEQRHIYCSPINENPSWYLITVMPKGVISNALTRLEYVRLGVMVGSSLVLIAVMAVIFILYYRMSQTQLRELGKAKQEAENANMAKREFFSGISHDIRTPMNAIMGMTEIALDNMQDTERVADSLNKIKLSGKHLLGLINNVLDMSKIESGKLTLNNSILSLREIMEDVINIIKPQVKAKNQHFDIFIRDIITEDIICDGVRLNQVLLNFLSNAIKFTPEEGRINVYLYQEESPLGDKHVRIHFLVEDNGIGMSSEFQEKIFDSFEREKTEQVEKITGSGLGMTITKSIIDIMNGTITLKSEPGKGSCFHVILDVEKAGTSIHDMKLPAWNILVVDDNEQLCSSAAANLQELGVHADWTLNGQNAVQMVEQRHMKKDDYQFVLIDWKMPYMDGVQTIREIRDRVGWEIPLFLISAYDWNDIEKEAKELEVEGFIAKPLFKSTLYSCLKQYEDGKKEDTDKREEQEKVFAGKRILLAEDIDINWEVAKAVIGAFGPELDRAVNGLDCVEKFEQAEIGYYDAILMDIRMPVMDGYDATRKIRSLKRDDRDLPIIAMTADAFSDDAQRCLECGMNAHIAKPIEKKECLRILMRYLKSQQDF